eukprot:gene24229-biopygen16404
MTSTKRIGIGKARDKHGWHKRCGLPGAPTRLEKKHGETATPASGPRPVRVRSFEFDHAARVRSAPGPRPLPCLLVRLEKDALFCNWGGIIQHSSPIVWCSSIGYGLVWLDLVWFGLVWLGLAWRGLAWL